MNTRPWVKLSMTSMTLATAVVRAELVSPPPSWPRPLLGQAQAYLTALLRFAPPAAFLLSHEAIATSSPGPVEVSRTGSDWGLLVSSSSPEYDVTDFSLRLDWKRFADETISADLWWVDSNETPRSELVEGTLLVDVSGTEGIEVGLLTEAEALALEDGVYCRILRVALADTGDPHLVLAEIPVWFEMVSGAPYRLTSEEYDMMFQVYEAGVGPDGSVTWDIRGLAETSSSPPTGEELAAAVVTASGPIE